MPVFTKAKVLFALLIALCFTRAFAYNPGDFHIALRIPLAVPTLSLVNVGDSQDYSQEVFTFSQMGYKNIQAGIEADVGYFLTDSISLGGLIGYDFAYDRGDRIISKVPLLFKAGWYPYSDGTVDLPVSFLVGVNYWKYNSQEHIVLQTGLELGVNVFWSKNWGASFRTGFWIYPELYADRFKNSLSGFIPIVLGVTYRR